MSYIPAGKAGNALLQAAYIIELEHSFPQEDFRSIDKMSSAWQNALPRRTVSKGGIFVNPQTPQIQIDDSLITGLSYEFLNGDGTIRESLRLEGNRVIYLMGEYTIWNEVWPRATKILEPIIQHLSVNNTIIAYSSEYTNLFVVKGDYFENDLSGLFRPGNELVPQHIFDRKLNWHSHTGFFEEKNEPASHRLLTRINLDIRDNSELKKRELTLLIFHSLSPPRDPFSQAVQPLPKEITSLGLGNFRILHINAREVLKKLLCYEMLQCIGMKT